MQPLAAATFHFALSNVGGSHKLIHMALDVGCCLRGVLASNNNVTSIGVEGVQPYPNFQNSIDPTCTDITVHKGASISHPQLMNTCNMDVDVGCSLMGGLHDSTTSLRLLSHTQIFPKLPRNLLTILVGAEFGHSAPASRMMVVK